MLGDCPGKENLAMSKPKIAILDLGLGNMWSVASAVRVLGIEFEVVQNPECLNQVFSHAILPGVGHFGSAARQAHELGWGDAIGSFLTAGNSILGICLGFQLLGEGSDESKGTQGFGILPGQVEALSPSFEEAGWRSRVPHMGFNSVRVEGDSRLLLSLPSDSDF